MKMQKILTDQHKYVETLKGGALVIACLTRAVKTKVIDKGRSVIILCIKNKILREVSKKKITTNMWVKLE